MKEKLNLPALPKIIECFDISNLGYEHVVAGMVIFVDGKPDKDGCRGLVENPPIAYPIHKIVDGINYWTSYVDNSKIYSGSTYYTLLPCDGSNKQEYLNTYNEFYFDLTNNIQIEIIDFNQGEQSNFRVVWYEDENTNIKLYAQAILEREATSNSFEKTAVRGTKKNKNK
jgi:hypothetical protein